VRSSIARPDSRDRASLVGLGLFLVGLIARLLWLASRGLPDQEGGDALDYIRLGRHLAAGLGFTSDGLTPYTYRPPLFAGLLAAWCRLTGNDSIPSMVACEVVLQSLAAPLTFLLARRLQPSRSFAVLSGLIMAVNPFLVSTVGLVLQEPIQTLAATAMGLSVAATCGHPTVRRTLIAGLSVGIAALSKSPFLVAPLVILLVPSLGRDWRRRLPVSRAVLAGLVAMVVVFPWTLRNYRVSGGRFIPINSQDLTLPIWLTADQNFPVRESPSDPAGDKAFVPAHGVLLTYGNAEGVALLRRTNDDVLARGVRGPAVTEAVSAEARSYLRRHPWYVLAKTARGLILLCSPDAALFGARSVAVRIAAILLIHLPLTAGLLAGGIRSFRERNPAPAILAILTVAYLLVHAPASIAGGRYAVPVLPLMMALTGYACFGASAAPDSKVPPGPTP